MVSGERSCYHEIGAFIWFNNLEKILLTFEDLDCQELLG